MKIDNKKFDTLLKEQAITKSKLGEILSISSRTISKISKNEEIRNDVIDRICQYFKCKKDELIQNNVILETLREEKKLNLSGGIYHATQIKLTYNSNHIEGSKLTEEQTRFIFETQTVGEITSNINIDDIIESNNHFKCVDFIIDNAEELLSEELIKKLHLILKQSTAHSRKFVIGEYKQFPNTIGGNPTTPPAKVEEKMKNILAKYNSIKNITFNDIVTFHHDFEELHPFQDGNGRVGRLIAFKECLKANIVPFYIDDKNKWFYYRGLNEWDSEPNFLLETCLFGQDQYKLILKYFNIEV